MCPGDEAAQAASAPTVCSPAYTQTHAHTLISRVTSVSERQRQRRVVKTVTNIISLSDMYVLSRALFPKHTPTQTLEHTPRLLDHRVV